VASDKGVVVGRVQFKEAGDEIDCTKMGIGGKAIPPHIDKGAFIFLFFYFFIFLFFSQ
jgi:DNA topoisomerase VI subunit A